MLTIQVAPYILAVLPSIHLHARYSMVFQKIRRHCPVAVCKMCCRWFLYFIQKMVKGSLTLGYHIWLLYTY